MKAKFMQMVRTATDSRDTAGDLASCEIECANAVAVARDLDAKGERSKHAKVFPPRKEGSRLAVGHGVTIKYPNGNLRTVRAWPQRPRSG